VCVFVFVVCVNVCGVKGMSLKLYKNIMYDTHKYNKLINYGARARAGGTCLVAVLHAASVIGCWGRAAGAASVILCW